MNRLGVENEKRRERNGDSGYERTKDRNRLGEPESFEVWIVPEPQESRFAIFMFMGGHLLHGGILPCIVIKFVYCLRRLPDLSDAEFHRYWRDVHAPLVTKYADALSVRRYVQVHSLDNALNDGLQNLRGAPERFDGIAELWYDSVDAFAAAVASPEGREAANALAEDERKFIDHSRSPMWLAEEHPIIEL